ncbi:restriction endonuclease subunit S [Bacteroides ihuae]|uniref:restriction endonuclease subunit S n=1 Tax=Bacteroides ihuae TaxID=1852362 RepID=UPI0008D9049D|nr:restriction endonuclease subunit S [Bacteroides ihuae]
MSEWKDVRIGDYIDLISGFAFKSSKFLNEQVENSLPIIKIKNVASGDANLNDVVFHKYDNSLEKFLLEKNDILIAMTGNHPQALTQVVGGISKYKLDVPSLLNQRVGKIIAKGDTCLDFIYYLFKDKEVQNYLANQSSGSANQANISKNDILELNLRIPSPTLQRTIAGIFSSIDHKIDLLNRQNRTLESMAETLFRHYFIDEAQEEWEEKSLSQIASFLNGLACQKFPPKNGIKKLPVLKIKELSNGITEYSDWATTEIGSEYLIHNGDIIFAWSASLIVKIWDGEDCILNQHLFKVTSNQYPKWFYFMWCKFHLKEFRSIANSHATTMGHIKRGDLDTAMVLVPPNDKLKIMTEQMQPMIEQQILNNKQISILTKLRDTLLSKLMNNEIQVE